MIHATLRESDETLHHIEGPDTVSVLGTAGLLSEAINYRNGFSSGEGEALPFSVVSEGINGVFSIDEYLIRGKGSFWLLVGSK